MVVYAGFDIGIKNLAYCIIDSQKWKAFAAGKSTDCGILDWQNINLVGDPPTCCGTIKKTGAACNKKASKCCSGAYYCGMHALDGATEYKPQLIKNMNMAALKIKAFGILDSIELFNDVRYIVIETQPRKNQMMKMFATSIETYFLLRQKMDKGDAAVLSSVRNSPAKSKLGVYTGPKIDTSHIKDPYDRRKWLAQEHVRYFLAAAPAVLEQYFVGQKRDDLADAFLHCLVAIRGRAAPVAPC